MKRSFFQKCLRYLIPPHCGGCGTVLDPADPEELCPSCLEKWARITEELCPHCHKTAASCTCQPEALSAFQDVIHLSLLFYKHYDAERLSDQMIYEAKRKENADSFPCLAAYLAEKLCAYAAEHHISLSDYVILYPPRTEENLQKYGFDHAARLAKTIAARCGMQYRSVFCRVGGTEQKISTAEDRKMNAEASLFLKAPRLVQEAKGFVLFDDVVTTGATTARCIHPLREISSSPVIVLSIAKTVAKETSLAKATLPPASEPLWFE